MSSRNRLLGSCLAFGAAICAPHEAWSQVNPDVIVTTPQAETDASADEEETIVVTGSRIPRQSFETASPTMTVSGDEIAQRGAIDVLDVLNEVPALRGSFGLDFTGGQADIGVQRANLRGFGTHRSLVVVNNRRRVSTSTEADARGFVASSFDISNIPTALIERVDVVTGGASSVYGSDAISGAINIVLRDDFDGIEIGGTGGSGFGGDRTYYNAYITGGGDFAGGNAIFHIEHAESGRLARDDIGGGYTKRVRNNARGPAAPLLDPSQPADAFITFYNDVVDFSIPGDTDRTVYIPWLRAGGGGGFTGFFLPIDGQGNVLRDGNGDVLTRASPGFNTAALQRQNWGLAIYDPALGRLRAANLGSGGAISSFECLSSTGCEIENYNYDEIVPQNRTNLYASFTRDVFEGVEFVGEAIYSRSFSSRNQNPSDPGVWFPAGFEPVSELFVDVVDANGAVVGDTQSPFFPLSLINQIYEIDPSYNPASPDFVDDRIFVGVRQLNEHGPRLNTYERDYFTLSAGLRGELPNGWSWQGFYDWGRSSLVWTRMNDHEDQRLIAATDIVQNQATGDFMCRDATWRALGCVPADLVNGISPEAVSFLTFNDVNVHSVTQELGTVNLSGDTSQFFSLPGGAISFAIGAEWRSTDMRQDPGNGFVRGLTYGGEQRPRFNIETSVREVYGEAVMPILRDAPFAHLLELEGGVRYSEQSNSDEGDTTWKLGGRWAPIEDVRLRVMQARSARSPSGSELFQPTTRTFTSMTDPCDTSQFDPTQSTHATRLANCMSILGLNEADTLAFASSPSNIASQAGNVNLTSEVADTFTAGFVITPRFLPGLLVSVDYYDIRIEDLITDVGVQSILDACVLSTNGVNNQFCALVSRNPTTHQIALVTNAGVNINSQSVRGVDAVLSGSWGVDEVVGLLGADSGSNLGDVSLRISAGYQLENEFEFVDPVTGAVDIDDNLGEFFAPRLTVQSQIGYSLDELSLYWSTFWVRETTNAADRVFPGAVYHDFSAGYDLPWSDASLTFAVQNVFNESGRRSSATCCSPGGAFDRGYNSRAFSVGFRLPLGRSED